MKSFFPAAGAALLLAACQTAYPPGDPYGAPYPPQSYPPGPAGSCPIVSSRDWRASVDSNPAAGNQPALVVTGTVVAPTAGYRLEFRPHLEQRPGYPIAMVATLQPFPPEGPAAQVLTTHDLRWQWPLASGPVGLVTIACGDRTLAEVPVARVG